MSNDIKGMKSYSIKKNNRNSMDVEITGVDYPIVNKLVRAILNDVETVTIDSVEIRENSSLMLDEILAHRLGLIPIEILDYSILNCGCDCNDQNNKCSNCQVTFECNLMCTEGSTYVMSSHLKTNDPRIKILDNIMLFPIREGQTIRLTAVTQKGSGKVHAKWKPVSVISFDEIEDDDDDENILKPKRHLLSFETTHGLSPEKIFLTGISLVPELSSNYIFE
jgi:DNA-directed RNA polymerase alpha subunit